MGLDMYLERAPRYKKFNAADVYNIEAYISWRDGDGAKKYTLKEWCGIDESMLPPADVIKHYEQYYSVKYYAWDDEHKYGHGSIIEHVGYWRKANHIHKWFVENVQDGEDDCGYYEVDQEQLEELLDICKLIKSKCQLVKGNVKVGEHLENGEFVADYEDGQVLDHPEIAEEYLPTQCGFFFGGTDYDEWYMQDIDNTIDILEKVLEETDFETQMVIYSSSW